jgi:very-short-patch-repair endonuclease
MTLAEKILWNHLSNKQMDGYRFKRQHPIRNYIADFYCHKANLVIEVDGKIHETEKQMERDREKTAAIEEIGCRILRFTNDEVFNAIDQVIQTIKNELHRAALSLPQGGKPPLQGRLEGHLPVEKKNNTI